MDRRRHPFYKHSDAAFFVAESEGDTLARVAVLENRRYNAFNQSKVAFFYYFDTVDDTDAAVAVLDAAAYWARQRGLDRLLGPKGLLRSDPYGILVEGFEYDAALSMPYNYDYYPRLVETAGFEKLLDYLSGYVERGMRLPERLVRMVDKIKQRYGFEVRSFRNKRELQRLVPQIQRINNEAFTDVWGYYPIDTDEVEMISKQLLTIADPRFIKVVVSGDEIAGFLFIFPDISKALRETRGRLWPLGWIKVLQAFQTTQRLSGNGVGLLPQYQGMGASVLLYTEIFKTLVASRAMHCDVAQAMETNVKSLGDMNLLGVNWYKRHRVYQRVLSGM
ncbi:MAG: hypothetical protein JXA21_08030 [Anaerolineae bacterium]|nr:hypothetical protein [Anaerolineae bacterium]